MNLLNNFVEDPKLQRWGALAFFVLAVALIMAQWIYLVGNLRDSFGVFGYALADFLYGPLSAASLLTAVYALRERIGARAPRRMTLAFLAAALAAAALVAVACIRAANRHYHLSHPELQLENSTTVLIVWGTLISGLTSAGWHFMGWALVLLGSAGWTSRLLPRLLSGLYLALGVVSMFVYLRPDDAVNGATTLGLFILSIWQGILLWKTRPGAMPAPEIKAGQAGSG